MNLIIHGINGNMGKFVLDIANQNDDITIVAGIDANQNQAHTFPMFETIGACDIKADMIIDFSHYSLMPALLDYIETSKTPAVICTTGLDEGLQQRIEDLSQQVPLFLSGNMSLGINLLINLVKKAAAVLNDNFDIEIIEKHHNKKVDSPSGTAYMIAEEINRELDNSMDYVYGRYGNETKREKKEIGIHGVRGGTIVGEHDVIFAGPDEIIEIKHSARSKRVFAEGAVSAAKFLVNQSPGLYNMNHIL